MVAIRELQPGMRVKIVEQRDKRNGLWNFQGYMDKYCGTIMTVKSIAEDLGAVKMLEDQGVDRQHGWFWYPEMLDCVVYDEEDMQSPTKHDIASALGM